MVVTDPTDQVTDVGLSNATFTAAATSNPAATVQWFVQTNGAGAFNPVPGATSNTLTITSATLAQNGNVYHAVYTNTFTIPTSTATSDDATLTVNPALTIAPAALAGGHSGDGDQPDHHRVGRHHALHDLNCLGFQRRRRRG